MLSLFHYRHPLHSYSVFELAKRFDQKLQAFQKFALFKANKPIGTKQHPVMLKSFSLRLQSIAIKCKIIFIANKIERRGVCTQKQRKENFQPLLGANL